MSKDAMRTTRALILLCRQALRSIPDTGARDLFASRLSSARHDLYVLQLRQDMPLRGLLNGLVLGLSEKRYRISLQCLLGLLLLPFIGKRRVAALLLDVSFSRVIRSYFPVEIPGAKPSSDLAKTSSQHASQQRGLPQ